MKRNHILIACLSTVLFVASCKKEEAPKTTAEKIQAKWQMESLQIRLHVPGMDTSETQTGEPADYFDFQPGGKLYLSISSGGEADTLNYAFQTDTKIFIEGLGVVKDFGVYDIQTLTDNALKLYTKETDPDSPEDFVEVTFNLKK